ncbi:hypothetical protein EU805_01725 [Salipiger sp. IMCC34102]|uniref:hypothetical protein n=1 Tax=Salipiger sp. IMCC34102 TaxID=2510647 RepID=UPI00101C0401|nr:hypothetical protein [Salipiger sp. IMCC34102]RYH04116.1 hypothetical protein EU805_01725 [Salipiger sp. IMCC34102]
MEQQKSPLKSLTVGGGLAAVIVGAGQLVGVAVTPAEINELFAAGVSIVTIVSGVVAIVGRIRARSTIRLPWSGR